MIKFLVMGIQACFNIPQTFPIHKLGKSKTEKLVVTGNLSNPMIALVFFNAFVKLITWQVLQYLCKNRFSDIYRYPPQKIIWGR